MITRKNIFNFVSSFMLGVVVLIVYFISSEFELELLWPFFDEVTVFEEPFRGFGTTLSFFFLWSSALCMFFSVMTLNSSCYSKLLNLFLISQVVVFFYAGFDERVLIHEHMSLYLGVHKHVFVFLLVLIEGMAIVLLGRDLFFQSNSVFYLLIAGFLVLGRLCIDLSVGNLQTALVASLGGGLKLLATFFIFMFSSTFLWEQISAGICTKNDLQLRRLIS